MTGNVSVDEFLQRWILSNVPCSVLFRHLRVVVTPLAALLVVPC